MGDRCVWRHFLPPYPGVGGQWGVWEGGGGGRGEGEEKKKKKKKKKREEKEKGPERCTEHNITYCFLTPSQSMPVILL